MINLQPDLPPLEPVSSSRKSWLSKLLLVVFGVLVFAAGVFAAPWIQEQFISPDYQVVDEWMPNADGEFEDTAVQEPTDDVSEEELVEGETLTTVLSVDWLDPSVQPDTSFDTELFKVLYGQYAEDTKYEEDSVYLLVSAGASAHRLGTIQGGVYDGWYLEVHVAGLPGLGSYYESYYILRSVEESEAQPVLLDQMAFSVPENFPTVHTGKASEYLGERVAQLTGLTLDQTLVIPELELRSEVKDEQGRTFIFIGYWVRFDHELASSLLAYSQAAGSIDGDALRLYQPPEDVSAVGKDQFYLVDEDGKVLWFDLTPPFWVYEVADKEGNLESGVGTPAIIWNDGTLNATRYFKGELGGCGFKTPVHILSEDEIAALPRMIQTGVGAGPDGSRTPIHEPETYEHEYYTSAFNAVNATLEAETPKQYSDFSHAYFYFKDSADRWVEAMREDLLPAVECGKPVIYLYPENVTDLTVWVHPRSGFSFVEPAYHDGWHVTAYPDGRLVNREDGKEYPYLFWEGRGGLYHEPQGYWVVEQKDVAAFLRSTLGEMGLIEKEINDFLEFWLVRMQDDPYYKIGFHGTRVMQELAPLSLSQTPDSVFRVLMDYSPLYAWEPSQPPVYLPKAQRKGFTVIEWGGVLR